MAVMIDCNGKVILHVRSSTFEMLYQNIVNKQLDNDLVFPPKVQDLIDDLYTGCQGFGTDIANHLKNDVDATFFAELVGESVEKMEFEIPTMHTDTRNAIRNFYNEILKYADELKGTKNK